MPRSRFELERRVPKTSQEPEKAASGVSAVFLAELQVRSKDRELPVPDIWGPGPHHAYGG